MRETIRIAVAAIIQLRLLFGAFQHRSAGTRVGIGKRRDRVGLVNEAVAIIEYRTCHNQLLKYAATAAPLPPS